MASVLPASLTSSSSSVPISHRPTSRELPTLTAASWARGPRSVPGGHREAVNSLDWSLDGRKLASSAVAGGDKGIRIWDSGASGTTLDVRNSFALTTPHAAGAQITRLRWNPALLSELVSAGGKSDPQVCFWDVRASSTKPLTSLTLAVGPCEIAHHPDGGVLAVSDLKEKVTFFDRRMVAVDRPVAALSTAAAAGAADLPSTIDQASWQANGSTIAANPSKDLTFDISFTAAGDHFCIANSGGKVLVRSWASLLAGSSSSYMDVDGATKPQSATEIERPWEVDAQMGSCNALRFSRDGRFMATAGTDAIVNLWSTDGLIALKSFGDMTGEVKQLAFSNSGELLAAGGEESALYLFSTTDETFLTKVATGGPTTSMAWSPKHDTLAFSSTDREKPGAISLLTTATTS